MIRLARFCAVEGLPLTRVQKWAVRHSVISTVSSTIHVIAINLKKLWVKQEYGIRSKYPMGSMPTWPIASVRLTFQFVNVRVYNHVINNICFRTLFENYFILFANPDISCIIFIFYPIKLFIWQCLQDSLTFLKKRFCIKRIFSRMLNFLNLFFCIRSRCFYRMMSFQYRW